MAGYITFELDQLQLSFKEDPAGDEGAELAVKAEVELVDSTGVFKWLNGGTNVISSQDLQPFRRPVEEVEAVAAVDLEGTGEGEEKGEAAADKEGEEGEAEAEVPEQVKPNVVYTLGFGNFSQRSQYVDLNDEVLAAFANSSLLVKIFTPPSEEGGEKGPSFAEFSIPVSSLLVSKGCLLNEITTMEGTNASVKSLGEGVDGAESSLSWRLSADNDMAEFCLGCSVLQWSGAKLDAPPSCWSIHHADVIDPKAKVAATDEELRTAYLEHIQTKISDQENIATYTLQIGDMPTDTDPVEVEVDDGQELDQKMEKEEKVVPALQIPSVLPPITLIGKVSYNSELATAMDVAENLREKTDLWSINFTSQGVVFLSRNKLREISSGARNGTVSTQVPITLTKIPTETGAVEEGEKLVAKGSMDLSTITDAGVTSVSFYCSDFTGADFNKKKEILEETADAVGGAGETKVEDEGEKDGDGKGDGATSVTVEIVPFSFQASVSLSSPIIRASPKISAAGVDADTKTATLNVTVNTSNRDVLKELKVEIKAAITKISNEYLSLYPSGPTDNTDEDSKSFDDKKIEFMHYLSTNGVYHNLKESLKPKIQRVVRSRFGVRGQALNASGEESVAIGGSHVGGDIEVTDKLLAELYVFLVKQCNQVLNGLFSDTVVDSDSNDTQGNAFVDDEAESNMQKFIRLGSQGVDAEADGRTIDAEQRHLERLQVAMNDENMKSDSSIMHSAYLSMGQFYLRQTASAARARARAITSSDNDDDDDNDNDDSIVQYNGSRARESLTLAMAANKSDWVTNQLLACSLHENGQSEEADRVFANVVQTQLSDSGLENKGGLGEGFEEFSGYDTDMLCPVDPISYAVMSIHFSRIGDALKTRKALRLSAKSFVESGSHPPVNTHGLPRRTYVLVLARAVLYLAENGFIHMAEEGYKLVVQCEEAANALAAGREETSSTAPFIRNLVRRAEAATLLFQSNASASASETETESKSKRDRNRNVRNATHAATESVDCSSDPADVTHAWLAVSQASKYGDAGTGSNNNNNNNTVDALLNAITSSEKSDGLVNVPVEGYLTAAKLLLDVGRTEDSLYIALSGLKLYLSGSLYLVAGICYLRTDRLVQAENAIQQANILDNRSSEVWAYHCLVCLSIGYARLAEAQGALHQALRLGLTAAPILRDIGTAFIAVDKLQTAEELIRRALVAEGGKGSPYTRKLLGDVLAGQQQAAKAVEEYKSILEDPSDPNNEGPGVRELKLKAAQQAEALLSTLGRTEEVDAVRKIVASLKI